jgi:ERCC4-type nuclease
MGMKLLVDHREGEKIARVARKMGECEVAQLPLGDILIIHDKSAVVIERKTARDFVSSVRNNRLWEQLLKFMEAEEILGYEIKRRILVIHGRLGDYLFEDERRYWASMMGALLETIFVYSMPVILAENDRAFEEFLRIEVKREEEGKNESSPDARWYRSWKKYPWILPTKDDRRMLLSSVPFIGEEHAKNLLEHFGSIRNIAEAREDELREVKGIGKERAKRIYRIFH